MMKKVFALAMAGAMVVSMPVMAATSPTASAVASQAVVESAAPSAPVTYGRTYEQCGSCCIQWHEQRGNSSCVCGIGGG